MAAALDLFLMAAAVVAVVLDVILAVCLRFVLPSHITQMGYYPADGRKLKFNEALKVCPCLARVFPEGTREPIMFGIIEERITKIKRSIMDDTVEQLSVYSFVVSLSIPAYIDEPNQKIFACNGLIKSSNSLITTKACVEDESEWFNLTVRSGSVYWSKLGQEHAVVNFSYITDDLIVLEVEPKFAENLVPFPPLKYPFYGDWIHAATLGWDDNMYKKDVDFRHKNRPFNIEEWTSRECRSEANNVCFEWENCKRLSSKPLVTSCHQLIGMKFHDSEQFSSLGIDVKNITIESQMIQNRSCYDIYKDICQTDETEYC
ncbi:hypothetical protein BDFB_013786 [Asbolus verrucosus]|uniref:Trypsin domain containing protein n=1 Tax=Asbolus verrucosus TaxID=1661398 RepID=A0A482W8M1_ASBVE|nr:hypothetical protein BDFB_013786 [Asbolus verrucosus]